jgi:hypothetical protein
VCLLNQAHEEFRPVGFYEEWLVVLWGDQAYSEHTEVIKECAP